MNYIIRLSTSRDRKMLSGWRNNERRRHLCDWHAFVPRLTIAIWTALYLHLEIVFSERFWSEHTARVERYKVPYENASLLPLVTGTWIDFFLFPPYNILYTIYIHYFTRAQGEQFFLTFFFLKSEKREVNVELLRGRRFRQLWRQIQIIVENIYIYIFFINYIQKAKRVFCY